MDVIEVVNEVSDNITSHADSEKHEERVEKGERKNKEDGDEGTSGGREVEGGETGNDDKEEKEEDSDDGFDLGSFISDLESIGEDLGESLDDAKEFYVQLGCVVSLVGVAVNEGFKAYENYAEEKYKTAIINTCMLVLVQIPTLVALLFCLLKETVKAMITGFLFARKKLDELEDMIDDDSVDEKTGSKKPANQLGTKGAKPIIAKGAKPATNGSKSQTINAVKPKPIQSKKNKKSEKKTAKTGTTKKRKGIADDNKQSNKELKCGEDDESTPFLK